MTTPAVSVVMTAYNRERYIAAAVESVLAQTRSDFELVIVDDHSIDATVGIARRYLSDPRVRVVVNERNLGDYPNRNHAASFARGAFLKYHDSDDVMYPNCLEIMTAALETYPEAACAFSTGRAWAGGPCPMLLTPHMAYQREYLGQGLFHAGPAGALFRRDAFEALGRFPLAGPLSDNVFWFKLCAAHPVVLVQSDLFWYRVHPAQVVFEPAMAFHRIDCDRLTWEMLASTECPLDDAERRRARRNRAFLTAKQFLHDVRGRRFDVAWYRLRRSGLRLSDWCRYVGPPQRDQAAGSPRDASGEFVVPPSVPRGVRENADR